MKGAQEAVHHPNEQKKYKLPTGHMININEDSLRCPELLFNPGLFEFMNNVDEGIHYMTNKFLEQVSAKRRKDMYAHATCATDTSNVKFVFGSCLSIITQSNLSSAGFM